MDPPKELPTGQEFIRQLPERTRRAEETAYITDIFEHAAWAHEHLAEVCVNIGALAKVIDKATLLSIHKWGHETVSPTKHPRGVPKPDRGQAGQNVRRANERESTK